MGTLARQPRNQKEQLQRQRAFEAIAIARRNSIPISRAAKQAHTTLPTVKKWNSQALVKEGQRYRVKAFDRQVRTTSVILPSELGVPRTIEVTLNDSRTASRVNSYMHDVGMWLAGNMEMATLQRKWRGRSFTYRGREIRFETGLEALQAWAESGEAREVVFGSG